MTCDSLKDILSHTVHCTQTSQCIILSVEFNIEQIRQHLTELVLHDGSVYSHCRQKAAASSTFIAELWPLFLLYHKQNIHSHSFCCHHLKRSLKISLKRIVPQEKIHIKECHKIHFYPKALWLEATIMLCDSQACVSFFQQHSSNVMYLNSKFIRIASYG